MIRPLSPSDARAAAGLHALCFDKAWPEADFTDSIARSSDINLGAFYEDMLIGLVQCRMASDQAEILTICCHPNQRGAGHGQALLEAVENTVQARKGTTMFLDVAEDNMAALTLYRKSGYSALTRRKGYYRREDGKAAARIDAVVFSKTLSLPQ